MCAFREKLSHEVVVASVLASAAGLLRLQFSKLCGVGLALGTLFFAASLTPTLVPRTYLTQGVLAGVSFGAGYGLGVLGNWLWTYLELPRIAERRRRTGVLLLAALCLVICIIYLWRAAEWQNSIRALMQLEPVSSAHPFTVCAAALVTFAVLILLARLFAYAARALSARASRFVPRRVAIVIGYSAAIFLFWSLASGVLLRTTFQFVESTFRELDALIEPERPQPTDPARAGSVASLLKWDELGRAGREFIASGPSAAEITAFTKKAAREPIRVYVGLRGAESVKARAELALAELKRVKAFQRAVLVVITPTGTGWVDPSAMDALEYLHQGDVASVAVQYSYMSSPLSLLLQPEYGSATARALFSAVYDYWTTLPKDQRPRLYLHGLSLGAMNSERSVELLDMIGDPINGALWSGPPFGSRLWRAFTDGRAPGTPAWLPTYRDSRAVRFMNQDGSRVPRGTPWGPLRIVYLQYASDAVTFFDPHGFYQRPAWLDPRGPDVSPEFRWYPIVTTLQIGLDMAMATTTPMGYGHVFAPEHYVDAWVAVTDVQNWSDDELAALKKHLRAAADANAARRQSAYGDRGG
ncbi:MAG: alpha/beta-hydrolase family protein [Rhizobiales bacterium]|nr:alpha/beta-hydrolase family protein [Hyphomicrobiales bacterium]